MESDGHIFSIATLVLAIITFFVITLGGVMIYVFFKYGNKKESDEKNKNCSI